ncbi:peptide ABC transporter substrate-binding protein [Pontibacillus halophilus JSM 076056 = DSM 19796]|uniref:Peptide ABC transporter substrate-binding protein n=1 Tax=Pontibacillus halophilus JSM 076056 = DSM 19796 TaxID=1385510 RepID=A0A0A5GL83_9BACI|nr:ABC transporter substrate-binding protein [Pontibacillus halophilus]KGX93996.1 peptide ABC transporter substrate-binding protein [Pontibacillus halophilus JSM 076056 = DSM 19796]
MKKRSWLFALVSILMLSIFLVACNNGDEDEASNEADDTEETNTEETTDTEEASSGESQDTLVYARGGDSTSLDPITTTEGEAFRVTENIFETLVNYEEDSTELTQGLANDWQISEDGLTYTFTLEEGVKFHDGTDFNAEAVVFNFERWMNGNDEQFPYYTMFGGFKGDEGHVIESVTAVDETTVEFKLKRPQAPFIKNLAMSPFGIASPTAVEESGDSFKENPVGTGPFKFVEWKREEKITLEKNEEYWKEGVPKLNRVIYTVIPENSARLNALKTGEVDLIDGVNPSDVEGIKGDDSLQILERPSMNVGYLGFTMNRDTPLADQKVRQALSHAVPKDQLIEAFYAGLAEPASTVIPPSIEGYNDELNGYEYDIEKAKSLLEEAGYADGFEFELWYMPIARPYIPEGQKIAEVLQQSFAEVGVTANLQTADWSTYLEKARAGDFDAFLLGWTGDNGDPDNFIYTLLDKDSIGSNNYTYYSNDELHDVLIEAQTITDQEQRNELYKQAQEIIQDDAPWVPLVHSTPVVAAKANLSGYVPHPTGSEPVTNVEFK